MVCCMMIRFVQFEEYYNKNDNGYEEELKKLKEIEIDYKNISDDQKLFNKFFRICKSEVYK